MPVAAFTDEQLTSLQNLVDQLPAKTPHNMKRHMSGLHFSGSYLADLPADEKRTIVAIYADEIFRALDMDGGIPTAQHIIAQIEAGRMTGYAYFTEECACFYGQIATCAHGHDDERAALQSPYIDGDPNKSLTVEYTEAVYRLEAQAESYRDEVAESLELPDGVKLDGRMTPIETLLSAAYVAKGATHRNNTALAFIHAILTIYVTQGA